LLILGDVAGVLPAASWGVTEKALAGKVLLFESRRLCSVGGRGGDGGCYRRWWGNTPPFLLLLVRRDYAQISFRMLMVLLCLLFISVLGIKPFFV
jgi:hypothetical protein